MHVFKKITLDAMWEIDCNSVNEETGTIKIKDYCKSQAWTRMVGYKYWCR